MGAPWERDWAEPSKSATPDSGPWTRNWNAAEVDTKEPGGFVASVKQAIGSTIKGAGQVAADFIPGVDQDNPVKKYGQEVIDANPTGVNSLEDILDKPWTAVKEATGNAAGSMGGMVATRAAGQAITAAAPLAGPAAPIVAGIGQMVAWLGPAAIAALPSFGGIRDKQIINDPDNLESGKAKAVAALGAATVGAIETRFGPQNWALAAMTKEGRAKLAEKFATTTLGKSVLKGVGQGALIEGAEELVQNPVEQLAAGDDPRTPESLTETAFGGAMGAIGGGVIGGGAGALLRTKAPPQEERTAAAVETILTAPDEDAAIKVAENSQKIEDAIHGDAILQSVVSDLGQDKGLEGAMDRVRANIPSEAYDSDIVGSVTGDLAPDMGAAMGRIRAATPDQLYESDLTESVAGDLVTRGTEGQTERIAAGMDEPKLAEVARLTRELEAHDEKGLDTPIANAYRDALARKLEALSAGVPEAPDMKARMLEGMERMGIQPPAETVEPVVDTPVAETAAVVADPAPVTVFGKPLPDLTDKELDLSGKLTRSAETKAAVEAEAARRVQESAAFTKPEQAPEVNSGSIEPFTPVADLPLVAKSDANLQQAEAAAPATSTGSIEPVSQSATTPADSKPIGDNTPETRVFGKPLTELNDRQLGLAAKSGKTPEVKAAALAEIERRQAESFPELARVNENEVRESLERFAKESGWAEIGGRMIRKTEDQSSIDYATVVGRTKWLPNADWWPGREIKASAEAYRQAVEKALAGERLTTEQTKIVRFLVKLHAEQVHVPSGLDQAEVNEITEGLSPDEQDAVDAIVAEANSVLGDMAVDEIKEALYYENPDFSTQTFNAILRVKLAEEIARVAGVKGDRGEGGEAVAGAQAEGDRRGGEGVEQVSREADEVSEARKETAARTGVVSSPDQAESAGRHQSSVHDDPVQSGGARSDNRPDDGQATEGAGESRPILDLAAQTPADLATKAAQSAAEAAQRAAESVKQMADDMRGAFKLAGSDRAADVGAAAGQQDLTDKPAIADFGEKIGGARKDVWTSFKDQLDAAKGEDLLVAPLSKTWPIPDYQALLDNGADPWAVAFMHAARDAVPPKPRKAWRVKSWAKSVEMLRDAAFDLANGTLSVERAKALLVEAGRGSSSMADIAGRIELYELVGHSKSLEGVRISRGDYTLYEGKEYKPPKTIWSVEKETAATAFSNWPRMLATGDTKAEALAAFKEKYDSLEISQPAKKEASFDIYSTHGEAGYKIGKKIGRNITFLAGPFKTITEARTYRVEHKDELTEKLAKSKEIPSERRDTNEPRVGEDMRQGQDVTPQMFGDTFGFRGVEFGNWVEQGKRQADLNEAFDALMDMAAILGIPPKAISLNGELGLAFGERGSGGINPASAHYEPGKVVINLTKKRGAGSLGHEWWHALDNYFSRSRSKADGFMSDSLDVSLVSRDSNYQHQGAVRREMVEAFGRVMKSIRTTAIKARSSKLDAKRSKAYWTTEPEMSARAFESYLISKLQDQNASNDYLANIVDEATWTAAESLGFEIDGSYPYPTAGEIPEIRAGFDHLFTTIQTKETDKGVALFRRGTETATGLTESQFTAALSEAFGEKAASKLLSGTIELLPDQSKLPDHVVPFVRSGDTVYGFHDPKTDKTYAVLSNLSPEMVRGLVMHEVGVHYGFAKMLGEAKYAQVMKRLDVMAKAGNPAVKAARTEAEKQSVNSAQVAEETLAYLVQNEPKLSLVQEVIAAVKSFLFREFGILGDSLTVADLNALAKASVQRAGMAKNEPVFAPSFARMRDDLVGIPREGARFDVVDTKTGKVVGNYESRKRARNVADKRDLEYGAVRYSVRTSEAPSFSRASAISGNNASWDAPQPSRLDNIIYTMQDKQVDTRRVLEAIKKTVAVSDAQDVRLREELYHGRAAKHVDDFLATEFKPLLVEMAARKVTMPEFEEYLHARHAEERNIQIAKINPKLPDGGSGMDTQDARDYLTNLDPAKKRAYEALAKRVDAINAKTRQTIVGYGLESQDTVDAWESTYQNYVPLQREDMEGGPGTGRGFSVKGPATKRATGSKRAVVDILANIAAQREKAIVRGEKNHVATALVGLATANPHPDFWSVDKPPTIKYVDDRTGLVTEAIDPLYKSRENVVMARIPDASGKIVEHSVVFNESDERAMRMAAALKNLDMDDLGHVLGMAAKITRYFASVNTQYNPIFGVVNLTRDTQGALANLSSTELAGKQAEVMKNTLSALRGIYIDTRDTRQGKPATSAWAQLWDEFQSVGGKTGYRDMFRTSKDRGEAIEREIARATEGKIKGFGRAVFDWLADYNTSMENAVRLAAYKVGIDNGMTKERAASLAKNLTVNFNRKGQIATQAGAMYAFFNASVQGSARLAETLAGPAGRRIIIGGLTLGAMQALALAAAGFDDGEPPEFVREKNLILPIGGKKYLTLPMPLGLHVLPGISRIGTEFALSGFRDPGKRAAQIVGMLADAFNPVGSAGLSLQTITPTAIDPLAALAENKDWTGKPIAREDMNKMSPTPGHTRAKDTASAFSKAVSKGLNWISGGTNYKPGAFSPTPDQVDYLIGQATGGVGREAMKVEQTVASAFTGEDLPTHKVPLLGRFYGDADQPSAQAGAFYDNLKKLNAHEAEIKGRRKAGEPLGDYYKENPEARLFQLGNRYEKTVSDLRKRKRTMIEKDASVEQVKLIDMQIAAQMTRLNEQVKRTREASR